MSSNSNEDEAKFMLDGCRELSVFRCLFIYGQHDSNLVVVTVSTFKLYLVLLFSMNGIIKGGCVLLMQEGSLRFALLSFSTEKSL